LSDRENLRQGKRKKEDNSEKQTDVEKTKDSRIKSKVWERENQIIDNKTLAQVTERGSSKKRGNKYMRD